MTPPQRSAGRERAGMSVTHRRYGAPRPSSADLPPSLRRSSCARSAPREVPMLASVASATLLGVDGHVVTVEVHVSSGLPAFTIVGLPDTIVRESRERVRAALLSSELEWPSRRITVNLAPGGIRKHGAGLDVAVLADPPRREVH